MDSSVSPTHGEQENTVWNGHYACICYHPLFVFNQFGDLERCSLRPGNVHSADGWDGVLKPVVEPYQGKVSRIYFRADAGFANRPHPRPRKVFDCHGFGTNSRGTCVHMTERSPFLSAGWGRYQTRGLSFANYDGASLARGPRGARIGLGSAPSGECRIKAESRS